jgi:hypothetical protein
VFFVKYEMTFYKHFSNFILQRGCVMAQAICRRHLTAETRVRSPVTPSERLMVEEVALEQIFLQVD